MIQIANLNPIRLRDQHDFMYQNDCYFQKWQSGDIINIQFMADEVFTIDVFSCEFGYKVLSIPIFQQQTNLIDVDFSVYEISFSVNDLPDFGKYFFRIKNSDGIVFDSHPFIYGSYFDNTVLLKYYHSENDFNIIFETGIEFYVRVEGAVHNYSPKIDGDIYFDQKYDPTMLTSESYKTFIFQAGGNRGIPVWMADIVNEAFSCDNKKINNIFIERIEGADWEVSRFDNYSLIGISLEIVKSGDNDSGQVLKSNYVLANSISELVTNKGNKIYTNK